MVWKRYIIVLVWIKVVAFVCVRFLVVSVVCPDYFFVFYLHICLFSYSLYVFVNFFFAFAVPVCHFFRWPQCCFFPPLVVVFLVPYLFFCAWRKCRTWDAKANSLHKWCACMPLLFVTEKLKWEIKTLMLMVVCIWGEKVLGTIWNNRNDGFPAFRLCIDGKKHWKSGKRKSPKTP